MVDEGIGVIVWDTENMLSCVSRDDLMHVLRVEVLQLFQRSSCKVADLSKVEHLIDSERVDMCRHFYSLRLDSMLLVVCHGIERTDECRYVSTCLTRQIWIYVPEGTASAASSDGSVHVSCSAVV